MNPDSKSELLSHSPNGESFSIPRQQDYDKELTRLKSLVAEQRMQGREIVVVMGVGFVGAVMAGVIADSTGKGTDFKSVPFPEINGDILGNREAIDKVSPFIPKR